MLVYQRVYLLSLRPPQRSFPFSPAPSSAAPPNCNQHCDPWRPMRTGDFAAGCLSGSDWFNKKNGSKMDGSPWHIGIIDDYWWLLGCGDGWSLKIRELKSIWESKQEHMGMGLSLRPRIDWKFVRHFLANLWINAMNKEGIHWLIRSIISKLAISIHFGVVINPHRGYIWYGDRSQGHCKEF